MTPPEVGFFGWVPAGPRVGAGALTVEQAPGSSIPARPYQMWQRADSRVVGAREQGRITNPQHKEKVMSPYVVEVFEGGRHPEVSGWRP